MWDLPDTPDVVRAFGSLLTGGAAIWGAVIAQLSLSSWKAEKNWQQDNELAKKLLLALRDQKDAFQQLRNPFVSSSEMAKAYDGDFNRNDDAMSSKAYSAAIAARIFSLRDRTNSVYPLLVEADLLWNEDLEALFNDVVTIHISVMHAHDMTDSYRLSPSADPKDQEDAAKYRRIAFSVQNDTIDAEHSEALNKIYGAAKRRLGQQNR